MQEKLMRLALVRIFFLALVLALGLQLLPPVAQRALADEPCTTRGDNLTRNGSVTDGGYDTAHGTVINAWNAFLMGGDWPQYDLADNESANGDIGGSSSQYIHGDGIDFDAGIYQVVAGTQPGASYEFSVGWSAMLRDTGGGNNVKLDDVIMRQTGADPTGGTDPFSPNIVWGPEHWGGGGFYHPDMKVTFMARASQVTLFLRVKNNGSAPSDKVFFDVMCLLPRGDIPVQVIEPTPTPSPAPTEPSAEVAQAQAVQPTRRPPTAVPPTSTPTEIPPTPEPARIFTATPQQIARVAVTATPEKRAAIPQLGTGSSGSRAGGNSDAISGNSSGGSTGAISLAVIAGSIGIIGISLLGILVIGGFIIWRLFIRQVDDALDPAYSPDDQGRYQ